jgi:predicted nucleic acid-binding protein
LPTSSCHPRFPCAAEIGFRNPLDRLDFEFVSSLRGLILRGKLNVARAEDALTDFEDLPIQRWPAEDFLRRLIFALRENLSTYDAAYVALAETLDCPLVTRAIRLARSTAHRVQIEVR